MKCYDIDLTVRVRCVAKDMDEATEVVIENFRNGKYDDTGKDCLGVKLKEVL